jgi:hypothetical protein
MAFMRFDYAEFPQLPPPCANKPTNKFTQHQSVKRVDISLQFSNWLSAGCTTLHPDFFALRVVSGPNPTGNRRNAAG